MKKFIMAGIVGLTYLSLISCGPSKEMITAEKNTVKKTETIKAGEFYQFEIVLEDNMKAVSLEGDWRVLEGGDRKAKVFVMDEENFIKFDKDEPFKSYYDSGLKINHDFKIRLLNQYKSKKTLYYLIFDNPSEEDDIKIEFNLKMDFEWGEGTK